MKRRIAFLILIYSALAVSAQKNDVYKWSFTTEYGLSSLDGDGDSSIKQAFGASVEYDFLPFAGLSVDYYYFPLGGPTFSTYLNSSALNLTVDMNRLIFSRYDDKVILKGYLGYGIARYTSKYYSNTTSPNISVTNSASSFPVVALSVEYYLTRLLSAGAKCQFRPFNVNNLEGDPRYNLDNVTNDNVVAATLYLRFKVNSSN